MEEEVTVPLGVLVVRVRERKSGAFLDRPLPGGCLVPPSAVRLAVAPLANVDDEGEVPHELVVDDVVAVVGLLVLPQDVGPVAVDAHREVLVAVVGVPDDGAALPPRTGLSIPSRSALNTSKGVSGFPREFILMYRSSP